MTETWLSSKHFDIEFTINSYTLYRKDRESDQRGGGIAVYINNKYDFEYLILKQKHQISKPFYLIVTYIKPNLMSDKIVEQFSEFIDNFANEECIVVGDTNVDLNEKQDNKWLKSISDNDFNQLITCPTRISGLKSTIIDHVYTNPTNNISESGILDTGLSDHFPVFCG